MRELWALVRPYVTVARATAFLSAIVTPIAAVVIGWLAVQLAKVGIDLNQTQALITFGTVFAGVVATVVPIVRKFIDNRTKFEVAMIHEGRANQISNKALAHSSPDDDYELSQPDDIAESDAEDENFVRRERDELGGPQ